MTADPVTCAFQSAEPVDKATFHALLSAAVAVAQPASGPMLVLLEFEEFQSVLAPPGSVSGQELTDAAAQRLAAAVGTEGFVTAVGPSRLAVLAASDGLHSPKTLEAVLFSTLMRAGDECLRPPVTMSTAHWPDDGLTADELFVSADAGLHASQNTSVEHRTGLKTLRPLVKFGMSPLRKSA